MKLPLDNFQLIGVGVGTDPASVLRVLEKKIEHQDLKGFSADTLEKRRFLLNKASSILLDKDSRRDYEARLSSDSGESTAMVEVEDPEMVAGLLLLLESGQAKECLTLAYKISQKERFGFNSNDMRRQELDLLLDYASIKYAKELKEQRYFESAATVIEERLQRRPRRLVTEHLADTMENELRLLAPYRVLDLLSRSVSDEKRLHGMRLFESVIQERGGLDSHSDVLMTNDEFKAFFRQIREYLTVQEQIDLFKGLGHKGSVISSFIAGIALVASGFSQRKPERLVEAKELLKNINAPELEPMISNIDLLLGDIRPAEDRFTHHAPDDLKAWCADYSAEPLGQMCAWCLEWLKRDVLIGYRDVETEPDLDAYFNDRDVIQYIEDKDVNRLMTVRQTRPKPYSSQHRFGIDTDTLHGGKSNGSATNPNPLPMGFKNLTDHLRVALLSSEGLITLALITLSSFSLALFSRMSERPRDSARVVPSTVRNEPHALNPVGTQSLSPTTQGLTSDQMGPRELGDIIRQWHRIKKQALAGEGISATAEEYASSTLLDKLGLERVRDANNHRIQKLDITLNNLTVLHRESNKILVRAELIYSEKLLNNQGQLLMETPKHSYKRTYTLVKNGSRWVVD